MRNYLLTACLVALPITANSALLERFGGQAYYDDVLDITWLADASLPASNLFGLEPNVDIFYYNEVGRIGGMGWGSATLFWFDAMNNANYLGHNNWRPPSMDVNDDLLISGDNFSTDNEMQHLYHVDGITATTPGPFSNVGAGGYWSSTPQGTGTLNDGSLYTAPDNERWVYNFVDGFNGTVATDYTGYVWAVHDGDVGAVPIPSAVWLFGSGLLGLIGIARRKANA